MPEQVASALVLTAVATDSAVSRMPPASCAPTVAELSLSKPRAETVLAGSEALHFPFLEDP